MLKEKVFYYYYEQSKSCSEAMLLGASDAYGLHISEEDSFLFTGFRGGMGCGEACGALTGAIGALSRMYQGKEALRWICKEFVALFREKLGCETIQCAVLEPHYKTPERRCGATVALACEALETFVADLEASGRILQ